MPQNSLGDGLDFAPLASPLTLAQVEGGAKPAGEGHASEGAEEHARPGDMVDPGLLFANGVLVSILLLVFAFVAKGKTARIPRGFQNLSEFIAESMNNFVVTMIGPDGVKHTPFIGTLFLYIGLMNYIGLVPGLHSPTANITTTLALGIIVFIYVQVWAIKNNGLWGHFSHFLGPKMGNGYWMAPLMLPIELMSELFRPFTLAIRLFGNIFGEDVILVVLAGLGVTMLGSKAAGFIPFQFPIMGLALITCFVQAMVFSTLACIYLSLVAPHEHEHEHDERHAEGAHGSHAHAAGH